MRSGLLLLALLAGPALAQEEKCDREGVWQCCAFFCMANPAGPTAEPVCRTPIQKLHEFWRQHNGGFPSCPGFTPTISLFDPCPPGTASAGQYVLVMLGGPAAPSLPSGYVSATPGALYRDNSEQWNEGVGASQSRVCVAGPSGVTQEMALDGTNVTVPLYSVVYVQPPQTQKPYVMWVKQRDGSYSSYRFAQP